MTSSVATAARAIVHRTRGSKHGSITRLVIPGDLGSRPNRILRLSDREVVARATPAPYLRRS